MIFEVHAFYNQINGSFRAIQRENLAIPTFRFEDLNFDPVTEKIPHAFELKRNVPWFLFNMRSLDL